MHIAAALEGSIAERAAIAIDSSVLRSMLFEIPFVLEFPLALLAFKTLVGVNISDVRLQSVSML